MHVQAEHGRFGGEERGREYQAGSKPSAEPITGLDLRTLDVGTELKSGVGSSTN